MRGVIGLRLYQVSAAGLILALMLFLFRLFQSDGLGFGNKFEILFLTLTTFGLPTLLGVTGVVFQSFSHRAVPIGLRYLLPVFAIVQWMFIWLITTADSL